MENKTEIFVVSFLPGTFFLLILERELSFFSYILTVLGIMLKEMIIFGQLTAESLIIFPNIFVPLGIDFLDVFFKFISVFLIIYSIIGILILIPTVLVDTKWFNGISNGEKILFCYMVILQWPFLLISFFFSKNEENGSEPMQLVVEDNKVYSCFFCYKKQVKEICPECRKYFNKILKEKD